MSDFGIACEVLLKIEAGYSNSPNDPGGETNFGISKRSYPDLDIKSLTKEKAKSIYLRDFWTFYRLYEIENQRIATKMLLMVVNLPPKEAFKIVQKALIRVGKKVDLDGILGTNTIQTINSIYKVSFFLNNLVFELVAYYSNVANNNSSLMNNFCGWIRRALV